MATSPGLELDSATGFPKGNIISQKSSDIAETSIRREPRVAARPWRTLTLSYRWQSRYVKAILATAESKPMEEPDVHRRAVRTFGSQGWEREGSGKVSGSRAGHGQPGNDHARVVRAALGANNLWHLRRLHR